MGRTGHHVNGRDEKLKEQSQSTGVLGFGPQLGLGRDKYPNTGKE